jgi:hypothetical protein
LSTRVPPKAFQKDVGLGLLGLEGFFFRFVVSFDLQSHSVDITDNATAGGQGSLFNLEGWGT